MLNKLLVYLILKSQVKIIIFVPYIRPIEYGIQTSNPSRFSFQNVSSMNRFQSNLTFCNCLNLKTPAKIIVFLYFWVFTRDYQLNTLNWNSANPSRFSFQNISSMNRFQSNLTFCNCLNLKTPAKIIVFLYFWVFTRDYQLNTLNWNSETHKQGKQMEF